MKSVHILLIVVSIALIMNCGDMKEGFAGCKGDDSDGTICTFLSSFTDSVEDTVVNGQIKKGHGIEVKLGVTTLVLILLFIIVYFKLYKYLDPTYRSLLKEI